MRITFLILIFAVFPSSAQVTASSYDCSFSLFKREKGLDKDFGDRKIKYEIGDPQKSSKINLKGFTATIENNAKNTFCEKGVCGDASPGINLLIKHGDHTAKTFISIDKKLSDIELSLKNTIARLNCVKRE